MSSYMHLDVTLNKACHMLSKKSAQEIAWKSQSEFDEEKSCFTLPFFNDEVVVTYPEGDVTFKDRQEEVGITEKILILHYLNNSEGVPLSEHWIPFRELPGGGIYVDPFRGRAYYPFIKTFGKNPEEFRKACLSLGGEKMEMGNLSFKISVFKMVPVVYIIWFGDEEMPASGNILFNQNAPFYLPTEDYAIIGGFISSKLRKAV